MPTAGFKPAIPAIKRPQTYALDRTVTGIGTFCIWLFKIGLKPEDGLSLADIRSCVDKGNNLRSPENCCYSYSV